MSGDRFRAGLYLRLSKDDEGAGESASITTQRSILEEYARKQGLQVVDEYVDDGFTGTNFDRPAFRRLLEDIERGRINCVLTKDLSRLGRNGARTSDLLDEYFPERHVRYISVLDGYDSFHLSGGAAMAASLMGVVHEMYARDISGKIRASLDAKRENGDFIGSYAPYGYKKDTEHGRKNRLAADPETAPIVRRIFRLALDGRTPGQIARQLNAEGVATPSEYRRLKRPYLAPEDDGPRRGWTSGGVCKLLRNEVYLGRSLQGKTEKISFKSAAVRARPRSEWIVVEGTHEPLISEAVYEAVRRRSVSRRRAPDRGFENVFSGIARCADCGRSMTTAPTRRKGSACNLCCGGYKSRGAAACSNHFIDYELLCAAVTQELRRVLTLTAAARTAIAQAAAREAQRRALAGGADWARTRAQLERRARELTRLQMGLYEEHAFGRMERAVYEKLSAAYAAEAGVVERELRAAAPPAAPDSFPALLDEVTAVEALTRPMLRRLIDRIEVGQGRYVRDPDGKRRKQQHIRIFFRFADGGAD